MMLLSDDYSKVTIIYYDLIMTSLLCSIYSWCYCTAIGKWTFMYRLVTAPLLLTTPTLCSPQHGFYYSTRIPVFGRSMAYHSGSCDLYIAATGYDS